MATSKYSIVMSVYKNDRAEWLRESLDSLLNQTLKSDDIIIVVDGPIGQDLKTCLSKYESYKEISIIKLKTNTGLGNALNKGIQKARHELIGRMDSDDIAVRDRFEKQIKLYNKHKDLDILGGQIAEFRDSITNVSGYRKVPTEEQAIRKLLRRRNPFNHPSVMYRKSLLTKVGMYDVNAIRIEDYDLWQRAIASGAKCMNTPDVLVYYRITPETIKRRKTFNSLKNHVRARVDFYNRKYISLSDLAYGIATQTALYVMPTRVAENIFNKTVRHENV